jgi:hypothetical protein
VEFLLSSGHVFYLNNLIAMLVIGLTFYWTCRMVATKQYDKALHVGFSALVTILFLYVFTFFKIYWWFAPIATCLICLAKQIYNKIRKFEFDPLDLINDFIGLITITVFYLLCFILHNPKY